ncbi:MAG: ZIP family metal transporter [Bacteroidales bacterium]|jgi:zinc and cadmium transporter|nr:ZIP family metal transporter [Bacteroidales bacterium]
MEVIIAYLALFLGSLLSGIGVMVFNKSSKRTLKLITVFGGAFLFAVCFVDLIPSMFEPHAHSDCEHSDHSILPVGVFILVGFLIQLLLEQLSHGAEHGHIHNNEEKKSLVSSIMLLVGVSIHAFLEGFPIVSNGEPNVAMITGIIIHNIPLSIILVGAFLQSGLSKGKSLMLLSVFAVMAIIGSLLNQNLEILHPYQNIILGLVVGILLHVSITTLFDSEESHEYNLTRFLIVILAFAIVILLPAHTH